MAKARLSSPTRLRKIGNALTAEQLRSLVHYDPETGVFTWLRREERDNYDRTWNTKNAGKTTGTINAVGYVVVCIYDQLYTGHRLAWLYMTGEWPKECIDHINRVRSDPRFVNLREATHTENKYNKHMQSNNKSGYKGIYLHKHSGLYHALINHAGRKISLGYFHTAEEAGAAYKAAEERFRSEWVAR